jgi:hypothetical protein
MLLMPKRFEFDLDDLYWNAHLQSSRLKEDSEWQTDHPKSGYHCVSPAGRQGTPSFFLEEALISSATAQTPPILFVPYERLTLSI